ncbi:MAG: bifunctional pyr operon transcriptional regulator/uracil phosphoribosyltransferase PyrR [Thermoleophilia bacterium]
MPEPRPANEVVILTAEQMSRTLTRIAHEILEKNPGQENIAVVGIHTRGAYLAARIRDLLCEVDACEFAQGSLDISFYRDDVAARGAGAPVRVTPQPVVKATNLSFGIDGATIILVDDVLFTGRTIRAAVDALLDYGRPDRVQLAVLIDRGHRELPIRPDYVGKNLPTARSERIHVRVRELDGVDEVVLVRPEGE